MKKLVIVACLVSMSVPLYPADTNEQKFFEAQEVTPIPEGESTNPQNKLNQDQIGNYAMIGFGVAGMIICMVAAVLIYGSSPQSELLYMPKRDKKK